MDLQNAVAHDDDIELSCIVAQEYPAKVLGFAPLQLSDDVYNILNKNLGVLVDDFFSQLSARVFVVDDLLGLDEHAVMEEDQCQLTYSKTKDAALDKSIQTLTTSIKMMNLYKSEIEKQLAEQKTLERDIETLKQSLTSTLESQFGVDSVSTLMTRVRSTSDAVTNECSQIIVCLQQETTTKSPE